MPGRSIALGRRCRTCLNRFCIRYSIPPNPFLLFILDFEVKGGVRKGSSSLCRRLINERRLIEMAFVPVNLYPILQV